MKEKSLTAFELNAEFTTPGAGRNQGLKNSGSPFVQLLDSDTILDTQWLSKAVEAMNDDRIAAVFGLLQTVLSTA